MVGGRLASDRRVRDKSEVVTTGPSSLFSLFWLIVGARPLCVDRVTGSTGDDPAKIMLNKGAVALPPPGSPGDACHRVLGDP